jgi:carbonic anhydrase/acetyltransferase-like protein (isoleucine patch superfamily)
MITSYKGNIPKIGENVYIAEGAKVIGEVEIGDYSSIWFNAIVRGDVNYIKIGEKTNVQDNCVLHVTYETAPLIIGSGVAVGHGVILHGCTIEDNCLIGSGSIIWDGAVIGEGSIVGAGAVVLANTKVPPHSVILGFPAKIKKSVSQEQYEEILKSAEHYFQYAQNYIKNESHD